MDHGHILAQHVDGFLQHIMIACDIGLIQQIHRVKNDLQIGGLDILQHLFRPVHVIDDMTDHRLDRHDHSHMLRIFHHPVQIPGKGKKRFLRPALRIHRVLLVRRSRLRSHHARSQPGRETDLGLIGVDRLFQLLRIGIRQIQIAPKHRNVQIVFGKLLSQIHGKPGRERGVCDRKILDHLSQRHVRTGKALRPCRRQPLRQRLHLRIVQTNSYLHVFLSFCCRTAALKSSTNHRFVPLSFQREPAVRAPPSGGIPFIQIVKKRRTSGCEHPSLFLSGSAAPFSVCCPDPGVFRCLYCIRFILLPQAFW